MMFLTSSAGVLWLYLQYETMLKYVYITCKNVYMSTVVRFDVFELLRVVRSEEASIIN